MVQFSQLIFRKSVTFSAGVSNIKHRINCNEYIEYIATSHGSRLGHRKDLSAITQTIPTHLISAFTRRLIL